MQLTLRRPVQQIISFFLQPCCVSHSVSNKSVQRTASEQSSATALQGKGQPQSLSKAALPLKWELNSAAPEISRTPPSGFGLEPASDRPALAGMRVVDAWHFRPTVYAFSAPTSQSCCGERMPQPQPHGGWPEGKGLHGKLYRKLNNYKEFIE